MAQRYDLGALLGAGGFASVYRARDLALGRDVALKIIPHGELASFDRFRLEALALSRLKSRHIARVHDFGRDDELGYFLAMELIDGVPLEANALGRALLPHEVLRVARGLLSALAEAHQAGIIHRDIKPGNVLVPKGIAGLHDVRLFDFGIARSERRAQVREGIGEMDTRDGVVVGTPAYLAPELALGAKASPTTDLYAAGLVLFDLLGKGPLFTGETWSDQLAGRLREEPVIEGRVDEPLAAFLKRMLAREPQARFANAAEAVAFITDMETASVSVEDLQREPRKSVPPPMTTTLNPAPPPHSAPGTRRSSRPPPSIAPGVDSVRRAVVPGSTPPGSARPPVSLYGMRRIGRLDDNPLVALLECLHALDLAMLDALARRERDSDWGAVALAIGAALRLDLWRAADIIGSVERAELRAVGATLVATRGSRALAQRVDCPDEQWIDAIDPELAAVLVVISLGLSPQEQSRRHVFRCQRAVERLDAAAPATPSEVIPDLSGVVATSSRRAAMRTTLGMGDWCARALGGEVPRSRARDECMSLREKEGLPLSPLQLYMRSMLVAFATASADYHLTREHLERAAKLAAESGAALLEARASVALGGLLLEIPGRVDQGMALLDRVGALVQGADTPTLLYIADHNRGAALLIQGRYLEAARHQAQARRAAVFAVSLDHELLSATNEALSLLAAGDVPAVRARLSSLSEEGPVTARSRMHLRCVRSMLAMAEGDLARAEGELRLVGADRLDVEAASDGYLIGESLAILYSWARGEEAAFLPRVADLEKVAQDRGHLSFYFLRVIESVTSLVADATLRGKLADGISRIAMLVGPQLQAEKPV